MFLAFSYILMKVKDISEIKKNFHLKRFQIANFEPRNIIRYHGENHPAFPPSKCTFAPNLIGYEDK